jgi:hypothetical protein
MANDNRPTSALWNLREVSKLKGGAKYPGVNYTVELLAVGGGGSGGHWGGGGGGGAGGVIYASQLFVEAGCQYDITVGAGGAATTGQPGGGERGGNTTFCYISAGPGIVLNALGGGGGDNIGATPQRFAPSPHVNTPAWPGAGSLYVFSGLHPPFPAPGGVICDSRFFGGSGGGGGGQGAAPPAPFCAGSPGGPALQPNPTFFCGIGGICSLGCPGGKGGRRCPSPIDTPGLAGGGGGAGASGGAGADGFPTPARIAGCGGVGVCYAISGATVGYAGGGGGSGQGPVPAGGPACPTTGGGPGSGRIFIDPNILNAFNEGADGTTNRGGGGGGSSYQGPAHSTSGAGGSGILIIRYDGIQQGSGGAVVTCLSPTIKTIHCFTSSGCFIA